VTTKATWHEACQSLHEVARTKSCNFVIDRCSSESTVTAAATAARHGAEMKTKRQLDTSPTEATSPASNPLDQILAAIAADPEAGAWREWARRLRDAPHSTGVIERQGQAMRNKSQE
jgi:hypothetical protein